MSGEDNLLATSVEFIRRSGGHSHIEDFFTEVLATLIRLSSDFRDQFLELVFSDSDIGQPSVDHWKVVTQKTVNILSEENDGQQARLDLVLYGFQTKEYTEPNHIIAIEVKVGQLLDREQLEKYHHWLEGISSRYTSVHLAALAPARFGRLLPINRGTATHWRRRVHWEEVHRALEQSITEGTSRKGKKTSNTFRTYASEFYGLLAHEGLVSPAPLHPAEDAWALQNKEGSEYEETLARIGKILKLALLTARVIEILEDQKRGWYRQPARSGVRHLQDLNKGFVRIRFAPEGHKGTFLFFGVAYRQRGWMLRDDEEERPLASLDLLAGLEVWEKAGDDYASHLLAGELEGEGPPTGLNWQIVERLNRACESKPDIFVPRDRDRREWAKVVRRQSTGSFPVEKDAQVEKMADFYRDFLSSFLHADGDLLGYRGTPLLDAITAFLGEKSIY